MLNTPSARRREIIEVSVKRAVENSTNSVYDRFYYTLDGFFLAQNLGEEGEDIYPPSEEATS
jgi:hypothetical protein